MTRPPASNAVHFLSSRGSRLLGEDGKTLAPVFKAGLCSLRHSLATQGAWPPRGSSGGCTGGVPASLCVCVATPTQMKALVALQPPVLGRPWSPAPPALRGREAALWLLSLRSGGLRPTLATTGAGPCPRGRRCTHSLTSALAARHEAATHPLTQGSSRCV